MTTHTKEQRRSITLDELALEQALLNYSNETDMDADLAAQLNSGSLRSASERNTFKHAYGRHTRNIAAGNPFYSLEEF